MWDQTSAATDCDYGPSSPILAALLGPKRLTTPTIVSVDDNMDDMYAFLRLIRLGGPMTATASPSTSHSSSSAPATFTPTIAQYTGIHRLCLKYNGWYTRAVLDFHIELHAAAIVDSVGPSAAKQEVYALPSLAHAMQSVSLWVEVCDRLRVKRWWHALLNPWRMSGQDAAGLGPSVFSLVCILASVSSRAGLYSDLDELCVHYSEGEWGGGWWMRCGGMGLADLVCRGRSVGAGCGAWHQWSAVVVVPVPVPVQQPQ